MFNHNSFVRRTLVSVCLLIACAGVAQQKRPLAHHDYDSWRSIMSQELSPDGKFLAYGLFPQAGDGEVVIRNLATGQEWRQPAGQRPEPPRPNFAAAEDEPPPQVRIKLDYTADSKYVVFSTFAPKAEIDKAKRAKAKPEDMPKGGMAIVNLSTGQAQRVERVKSFQVPDKSGDVVVFLKEPAKAASARNGDAAQNANAERPADPMSPSTRPAAKKKEYGSELVARNLETGEDTTFQDVTEYTIAKDGSGFVYAVSSKDEATNGVYAVFADLKNVPAKLISGAGKYTKLTFDERQDRLAFLSDRDDVAARGSEKPARTNGEANHPDAADSESRSDDSLVAQDDSPGYSDEEMFQNPGGTNRPSRKPEAPTQFKLYLWERTAPAAVELASNKSSGFREGYQISDKGNIAFTRDGQRIFFGSAPPTPAEKDAEANIPDDDQVHGDLWHYKDDYIQPMQKVRAEADKRRTYSTVYHLPEKKLVQLADSTLSEITPSEDGLWALGGDDREYRRMIEYDTRYLDSYLVNTRTGEKKPIWKKHIGRATWSPDGKYVLLFMPSETGGEWHTVSTADLKDHPLTTKDGVKFWREEHDMPEAAPAYGNAGWTKDGKYVLVYDQFDIWRFTPDGSEAVNLTRGMGRKLQYEMRLVRLNTDRSDPDSKWIDSTKPLLIRADDKDRHDTGFFRVKIDAKSDPERLIVAPKNFTAPVQAKNADVMLFTGQTFQEFPDLLVSDSNFTNVKKVSDANPQISQLLWGSAELMHYRNADGVPLKGILYKPANFDPKQKYPMIVYIYERLSQGLHNFVEPRPTHNINVSYYTSNGYIVLEPDIAYRIGEPGQSALKCVLPAIDSVVAMGFVNEQAIGIQGHSWGGYQIAYMVTQTNRFKAAAAGAPVANMTSAYDGIRWGPGLPRQFQYEKSQSRIGATLWQAPLKFIENSPIFMADRVQTPLLLLHNDSDDAVPWYQGIEFYLGLRRLGKEVYMFSYNGEPHGLRRRPDQKDYTVRLQQFFDYELKGAAEPEWMVKGIPYLQRDEEKARTWKEAGYGDYDKQ